MSAARTVAAAFWLGAGGAAAMTAAVVWASLAGGGFAALGELARSPLYVATTIDVYIGIVFIVGWVVVRERSWPRTAAWTVLLLGTGNIGAGIYLALAARKAAGDLPTLMLGRSFSPPA